jgi:hypothetical protein
MDAAAHAPGLRRCSDVLRIRARAWAGSVVSPRSKAARRRPSSALNSASWAVRDKSRSSRSRSASRTTSLAEVYRPDSTSALTSFSSFEVRETFIGASQLRTITEISIIFSMFVITSDTTRHKGGYVWLFSDARHLLYHWAMAFLRWCEGNWEGGAVPVVPVLIFFEPFRHSIWLSGCETQGSPKKPETRGSK